MRPVSRLIPILPAVGLALAVATSAQGATITRTFDVLASGFGAGAPYDPVSGSFTVTWDPAVTVSDMTTGITGSLGMFPLNTLTNPIAFSYSSSNGSMSIGGLANNVGGLAPSTNDFLVFFSGAAATPSSGLVMYTASTITIARLASTVQITLGSETPAAGPPTDAPEPTSLALLAGALGAIGWSRRRAARPG